jgi:hypothetical protein
MKVTKSAQLQPYRRVPVLFDATQPVMILLAAAVGILLPGLAAAAARVVDCQETTIGAALGPGPARPLTLLIRGTCSENVTIVRDDVTLQGEPGAAVEAADPAQAAIRIDGARRVRIQGLSVRGGTGGIVAFRGATYEVSGPGCLVESQSRFGILTSYGSTGTVDQCTVQHVAGDGVVASNGASLVVTNSKIEKNTGNGAAAVRGSHPRLGQDADGSSVVRPVVIAGNGFTGVAISESAAGILVGGAVENNGSTGVFVGRGSSGQIGTGSGGLVAGTLVQGNRGSGISVEGGNATILASTIHGNRRTGISVFNGASARIGIRNDSSGYDGNRITANGTDGVSITVGSSAVLGGNTIEANGTDTSVTFRFGVVVSRATATLVGGNTIRGHASTGVFVGSGGSARIGDPAFGLPVGNLITGNGEGGPPGTRGGIFAFQGGVIETRGATIRDNVGGGVFLFEGGIIELREGTVVSGNMPAPGIGQPDAGDAGHGIVAGFRSIVRLRDAGTAVRNNAQHGVFLTSGSVVDFRSPPAVEVTGNGGLGLRCFAATNYSGDVTGITGNANGNVDVTTGSIPGCIRF